MKEQGKGHARGGNADHRFERQANPCCLFWRFVTERPEFNDQPLDGLLIAKLRVSGRTDGETNPVTAAPGWRAQRARCPNRCASQSGSSAFRFPNVENVRWAIPGAFATISARETGESGYARWRRHIATRRARRLASNKPTPRQSSDGNFPPEPEAAWKAGGALPSQEQFPVRRRLRCQAGARLAQALTQAR